MWRAFSEVTDGAILWVTMERMEVGSLAKSGHAKTPPYLGPQGGLLHIDDALAKNTSQPSQCV